MQKELIHGDFFLYSLFLHYCLINIYIFDYPDCLLKSQRVRIIEVFSFTLNVAYFSLIQIPIKWLPLLDLKLYFEGRIAQAKFK